jgi:hypothetical protein
MLKEWQADIRLSKTTSAFGSKAQDDPFTSDTKPNSRSPLEKVSIFSAEYSQTNPDVPTSNKPKGEGKSKLSSIPPSTCHFPSPPATRENILQENHQDQELPFTPTKSSKDKGTERRAFTVTSTSTLTTTASMKASFDLGAGITSRFDFSSQYNIPPKSFEFEAPANATFSMRQPEKPSAILDEVAIEQRKETSLESTISNKTAHTPETPTNTAPVIAKGVPNAPRTPPQPIEETFGYAIVTPKSKLYTTYLPAQQQYGMMTPPETPDAPAGLEIKIESFKDSFPGFSVSPAISRKPLPILPWRDAPLVGVVCAECGSSPDRRCFTCVEGHDYENVGAGCFHSLGLRLLGRKIGRKVKALRTKVSITQVERHKY